MKTDLSQQLLQKFKTLDPEIIAKPEGIKIIGLNLPADFQCAYVRHNGEASLIVSTNLSPAQRSYALLRELYYHYFPLVTTTHGALLASVPWSALKNLCRLRSLVSQPKRTTIGGNPCHDSTQGNKKVGINSALIGKTHTEIDNDAS